MQASHSTHSVYTKTHANANQISKLIDLVNEVAAVLKKTSGYIRVITHFDADGICAGAIAYRTLELLHKNFEVCFVRQLDKRVLADMTKLSPAAALCVFLDLGSGQLGSIKETLSDRCEVAVIDHHQLADVKWPALAHLNPFLVGVDGKDEISGAGLMYLVARALTFKARDMIDLAIVGATGDVQEAGGKYRGVNKLLLEDAIANGIIKHEKGLRLFGRYTRPLHKALEYWDEPFIPDISGSESGVVQFLAELRIPLKKGGGRWRTLADLTKAEEKRLATALILEGLAVNGEPDKVQNLIGNTYMLKNNYEVREFATILNACGRIEKPVEGMQLCLGKKSAVSAIVKEYKRKISSYLLWVKKNRKNFMHSEKAVYVFAQDVIGENFIGTVMSMAIRTVIDAPIVFGFANSSKGWIKVSARMKHPVSGINLGLAIKKASEKVGGEGGGHISAAGGKIPAGTEKQFAAIVHSLLRTEK